VIPTRFSKTFESKSNYLIAFKILIIHYINYYFQLNTLQISPTLLIKLYVKLKYIEIRRIEKINL